MGACAIMSRNVDRVIPPSVDYEARERAAMQEGDRCGPEFIQTKLPAGLVSVVGPVTDGPFRPVCARHDACYRLQEKSQAWCDDRMSGEMEDVCEGGDLPAVYGAPVVGKSLCMFHAGVYYAAINNTYASHAYQGVPGGIMTSMAINSIDDRLSDDELNICVDVQNVTNSMQEYDLEMRDARGYLIDREPDTFEQNIRAGETERMCVGTNMTPVWSKSDLTDTVHLSLRADTPQGFAFVDDMVVVDTRAVMVR
jgi:hypothetical protein